MDIDQLLQELFELSETDVLVEAKLSNQQRAIIDKALLLTSVEKANLQVKGDWDTFSVSRPLFRMYAPMTVKNALITPKLNIQLNLDSDRIKSVVLKHDSEKEKMRSLFAILRTADKEMLERMAAGEEKRVAVPAQVLQIKHIESNCYMYPIKVGIPAGVFEKLCKIFEISKEDMIEKILGD